MQDLTPDPRPVQLTSSLASETILPMRRSLVFCSLIVCLGVALVSTAWSSAGWSRPQRVGRDALPVGFYVSGNVGLLQTWSGHAAIYQPDTGWKVAAVPYPGDLPPQSDLYAVNDLGYSHGSGQVAIASTDKGFTAAWVTGSGLLISDWTAGHWSAAQEIPGTATAIALGSVAVAQYGGVLFVAYTTEGGEVLLTTLDKGSWSTPVVVADPAPSHAPEAVRIGFTSAGGTILWDDGTHLWRRDVGSDGSLGALKSFGSVVFDSAWTVRFASDAVFVAAQNGNGTALYSRVGTGAWRRFTKGSNCCSSLGNTGSDYLSAVDGLAAVGAAGAVFAEVGCRSAYNCRADVLRFSAGRWRRGAVLLRARGYSITAVTAGSNGNSVMILASTFLKSPTPLLAFVSRNGGRTFRRSVVTQKAGNNEYIAFLAGAGPGRRLTTAWGIAHSWLSTR